MCSRFLPHMQTFTSDILFLSIFLSFFLSFFSFLFFSFFLFSVSLFFPLFILKSAVMQNFPICNVEHAMSIMQQFDLTVSLNRINVFFLHLYSMLIFKLAFYKKNVKFELKQIKITLLILMAKCRIMVLY